MASSVGIDGFYVSILKSSRVKVIRFMENQDEGYVSSARTGSSFEEGE